MDSEWWIAVFVVAMFVFVAWTLYSRRQRATGISQHPIEDRPGAPGVGGHSGTGPQQDRSREDNVSQHGTR